LKPIAGLLLAAAALAVPRAALAAEPRPAARLGLPDGRLEVVPTLGWIFFGRGLAVRGGLYYGGEIAHHFVLDHPWLAMGAYAAAEGTRGNVAGAPQQEVDVVVVSGGVTWGLRGLGRLLPIFRAGAGFIVVDGTPSNLDIGGRLQFHVGAGLRYFLFDWLVLRLEARLMIHDNVLIGAGGTDVGDVEHFIISGGVGVAR
jgi:hypothetical protein